MLIYFFEEGHPNGTHRRGNNAPPRFEVRRGIPEERFAIGEELRTSDGRTFTVRRGWQHSGRWLVSFVEVPDRTAAEELRGVELLVDAPESDEEDAWYAHELDGLDVELVTGEPVGKVIGLEHLPAQDALVVREPSGAQTLVPLVTEIVPDVDIAAGVVKIDPPAGLLTDILKLEDDE